MDGATWRACSGSASGPARVPELPGEPVRYKLLPRGTWGATPWGVPDAAHDQAQHVVWTLQRQMDLCSGVEVRWFAPAGPMDWDGDPGVFVAERPLRGCVDPAAPTEARINVTLAERPVAQLIRTTVHEALHCEQLGRGLDRRLTHEALEQLAQEVTALLCVGVAG